MTTVVANLEVMAADQRITGAGAICHARKLHRIKGSLFGWCGDAMLSGHLLDWLRGKRDPLELYKLIPESRREDISALELSGAGLAYWDGWGTRLALLDTSYAIGSGSMTALGALRNGSEPAQAIALAMQLDECSGTLIEPHVETLAIPRKRRG